MNRIVLAAMVASFAFAAVALSAGAATTETYRGIFTGPVVYENCVNAPAPTTASGTWSVAAHRDTATLAVNIFTDGRHHVSFGGPFAQVEPTGGEAFVVEIPTGAGPLTVSLTGQTFTYRIAPYDFFGIQCESVTYGGVAR